MKIPILAKLCFFRLALDPYDDQKLREQETLIQQFVQAAQDEGNGVHLARALSMEAAFFAGATAERSTARGTAPRNLETRDRKSGPVLSTYTYAAR